MIAVRVIQKLKIKRWHVCVRLKPGYRIGCNRTREADNGVFNKKEPAFED